MSTVVDAAPLGTEEEEEETAPPAASGDTGGVPVKQVGKEGSR